jgi:Cu(I)/Ag(I) efflux system membrane fusion protein
MTKDTSPPRPRLVYAGLAIMVIAGSGGYGLARWTNHDAAMPAPAQASASDHKPLYWYDPMKPDQHFDKPGKSPFMDMQLVPKYAEAGGDDAPGIRIDPDASQKLGLRTVAVRRGEMASDLTATGTIDFNQRDVAIVQTRLPVSSSGSMPARPVM